MGEAVAPDGSCTPILLVISLFQVVMGATRVVYDVALVKESLFGSL